MFGFKKASTDASSADGEKGSSQQILLLVLVLLLAVFGYLYFFTGIIKPREEAPVPPPPAQVKQPIPARPEAGGATPATGNAAAPASPATPAAKPVGATTTTPAATTAATPAAVKPAAPVAAKPAAPAAAKPAAPVAAKPAAPVAKQPAPPVKTAKAQPAATGKPAPAAAAGPQKVAAAKPTAKASKVGSKSASGAYTLAVGEYVVEKSAASVQAKLKKLGIGPVVKTKTKRSEPMNRLYLASFDSHQAADAALGNLKKATSDGFILPENGKYVVYAGSYFNEGKAAVEQDRLYEKGYKLVMKKTMAPVPVVRLTAGRYASKDEAVKDIASLKKHGIKVHVVKAGK